MTKAVVNPTFPTDKPLVTVGRRAIIGHRQKDSYDSYRHMYYSCIGKATCCCCIHPSKEHKKHEKEQQRFRSYS